MSWLYGFLYRLLLIWYAGIICGILAAIATWPSRPIVSLGQVPWWSQVVALVIVAATWAPVSGWLSRGVHHLVFGQRDNEYEVAASVYRHLRAEPDPLLPTLAATLARTLNLPYVAIQANSPTALGTDTPAPGQPAADDIGRPTPDDPGSGRPATRGAGAPAAHDAPGTDALAVFGAPPSDAGIITIPLRYHHLTLGTLAVSGRSRRDPLSSADLRLLDDLARHVGITLHAAQLSADLQASREQLVAAREEERRRIRRDLHDGLGPTLASLRLQLTVLPATMRADPDAADRLVADLLDDTRAATAEIRRLVYQLRPPMLDEFGLVGALRSLRPDDGLARTVEATDPMPPLPAAVEVALYRVAAEALHNAVRHAEATRCAIVLTASDDRVTLTVTDDGRGLPTDLPGGGGSRETTGHLVGVGHRSMLERAAELGGSVAFGPGPTGAGTRVTATFPLKAAA